ncbi:PucR family transcriptional regulator [Streptacidiphilus sp. N1-12]|uniref:PucR family transcriptional regulator n=2 Tax=Streptacidiphilus alkalitolerans TaxID=3342712 RepID=A0ABV6V5A6_9ACTN
MSTVAQLPRGFAALVRPELPSLLKEIREEIRTAVPHYARQLDGPYARAVQMSVELSVAGFVDRSADPATAAAATVRRDKLYHRIGRFEAYEGRGLEDLETAFRTGARVCLRRGELLGKRHQLPSSLLLAYADRILAYGEELIEVARGGYLEARAEMEGSREGHRRRLLRLLLAGTPLPSTELDELADQAAWPMPRQVTLVALRRGALPTRSALGGDVLVDLADSQPHAMIPGPVDEDRRALFRAAPSDIVAAIGPTVATCDAARSLYWARRTLALVASGALPRQPVTYTDEHLVTLWLAEDPALVRALARRHLGPLADLTGAQRERLVETLRAWLATHGNAVRMAEQLRLHPQTVRYRMRLVEQLLGPTLHDPEGRLAVEIALRGWQPAQA